MIKTCPPIIAIIAKCKVEQSSMAWHLRKRMRFIDLESQSDVIGQSLDLLVALLCKVFEFSISLGENSCHNSPPQKVSSEFHQKKNIPCVSSKSRYSQNFPKTPFYTLISLMSILFFTKKETVRWIFTKIWSSAKWAWVVCFAQKGASRQKGGATVAGKQSGAANDTIKWQPFCELFEVKAQYKGTPGNKHIRYPPAWRTLGWQKQVL